MPIHLTFDDGPGPLTGALLDVLKSHDVRATFFVIGKSVEEARWQGGTPAACKAMLADAIRDGHEIGNHTYSHKLDQTEVEFAGDVNRCDAVIAALYEAAGQPGARVPRIRLPYGVQLPGTPMMYRNLFRTWSVMLDPRINLLASLGRAHFHWTEESEDWRPEATTQSIVKRLVQHITKMEQIGLNSVVVLHDRNEFHMQREGPRTLNAVKEFLVFAKTQNWKFLDPV